MRKKRKLLFIGGHFVEDFIDDPEPDLPDALPDAAMPFSPFVRGGQGGSGQLSDAPKDSSQDDQQSYANAANLATLHQTAFSGHPQSPDSPRPLAANDSPDHNSLVESDSMNSMTLPASNQKGAPSRPRAPARQSRLTKLLWTLPFLLAAFCFWKAIPPAGRPANSPAVAAVPPSATVREPEVKPRALLTRPIEEIRVGHRVLAENPELAGHDVPQVEFEPDTTRLVVFHQIKPDGHALTVEKLLPLETLVPAALDRFTSEDGDSIQPLPLIGSPENVFLHETLVGHVVELNMPELGAEGPATIRAVRPCPPLEPDNGTGRRLVTSVFRHAAANVVDLTTSGSDEPIGVTANHPFWSEDRQAFVPAGELQPGERLRRADGRIDQVTSIIPRAGPERVFNFEVDGQHAYKVGRKGLLVHNGCTKPLFQRMHDKFGGYLKQLIGKTPDDLRTAPGRTGIDAAYDPPVRFVDDLGRVHNLAAAELKPLTFWGLVRYKTQLSRWRGEGLTGDVGLFMYSRRGRIYFIDVF
jgi:hypothetical protein